MLVDSDVRGQNRKDYLWIIVMIFFLYLDSRFDRTKLLQRIHW